MAAILFYFILISLTCLWSGFLFQSLFLKLRKNSTGDELKKHWIIYAFWGLIFITLFGQILELIMPVNQFTWLAFASILGLVSIFNKDIFKSFSVWLRDIKKQSTTLLLLCAALAIFISVLSAGPTLMDDTASYHIQMIKWIQEYGTVLGLANLHPRFGFNSSWFTFSSLFVPRQSQTNFFTMGNGVLSVWLSVYLVSDFWKLFKFRQKEPGVTLPVSCLLIFIVAQLCWPMIRGNATNVNYDFVTACMIIVLFIELSKQQNEHRQWNNFLPELVIWPVFMLTVRMINFPILLMSLFSMTVLIHQKNKRLFITCSIISLALILPFLVRNVMLSGFLFYPIYQIDIFPVDWKVNPDIAKDLLYYIKYFNRVNTGFKPILETQKLGFPQWITSWFHYLFIYDKPFLLLGLAGYVLVFIRLKLIHPFSLPVKFFIGSLIIQLISWFLIAPDPRFIYGPLLTGIFLIPFLFPGYFVRPAYNYKKISAPLVIILFGCLSVYTVLKLVRDDRYSNFFLPARLPLPPNRSIKIDNIEYRIPEKVLGNWNARCYATDLPCLYDIQPGLSARGKTISEGFKINK